MHLFIIMWFVTTGTISCTLGIWYSLRDNNPLRFVATGKKFFPVVGVIMSISGNGLLIVVGFALCEVHSQVGLHCLFAYDAIMLTASVLNLLHTFPRFEKILGSDED